MLLSDKLMTDEKFVTEIEMQTLPLYCCLFVMTLLV
jgi:hypothetical protein